MSLTTAVSEDDDAESVHNSPYKAKQSGSGASFNCTGAVRKAGFLSVKKWLLRKKHQVELVRKRGWKGYWVCLKGTTLLFYPCDSREVKNETLSFSNQYFLPNRFSISILILFSVYNSIYFRSSY